MSQSKFKAANLLAGTALVALGVAFAGQASAGSHAKVIKTSKHNTSLKISGQFSRSIHHIDDGQNKRVHHQDSNFSSSRLLFDAAGKINSNLKVGARLEVAVDDGRNNTNNVAPNGGRTGNDFQTRKTEIHFTHGQLGKLWVGAGDTATNGVLNINTHGIYSALPGDMALIITSTAFTNSGDSTQGIAMFGAALRELDFNSRHPRIRYDTPVFGGFMASVSHNSQQSIDYALRYSGKMLDTKVKAAAGLAQNTSGAAFSEMYGAQISARHSSGLGATLGCGYWNSQANSSAEIDPAGCAVQGHFQRKFNEMGQSSIVLGFEQKDDFTAGAVAKGYAVTLHQKVDAAALEVWAKYSTFELDLEGSSFNDIDVVSIGTRLKF